MRRQAELAKGMALGSWKQSPVEAVLQRMGLHVFGMKWRVLDVVEAEQKDQQLMGSCPYLACEVERMGE